MEQVTVMVFGNLLALSAELEGMKAANADCERKDFAQAYDEGAFCEKADEIRAETNRLFQ